MASSSAAPANHWSETPLARVLGPMQHFVHHAAASGSVLLIVTVAAIVIANSPLAPMYTTLLTMEIGITIGPLALQESLLHWINDGLMAVFFFLVGLEIKREILVGELSNGRAALLPILAALGGVIVPAAIYVVFNRQGVGVAGWGIPMATDIAFALGCLTLLGARVPFALKVFLTAVAIVDDLIAVLVIALFYSHDLNLMALSGAGGVLALLLGANRFGIRTVFVYLMLGAVVWVAFLVSGVHATMAGVLVALTIPARNRIDGPTFLARAYPLLQPFEQHGQEDAPMLTDEAQQSAVIALERICEDVQAPLQKMEHALHGWVAFLIMPIFAFANAGVGLSLTNLRSEMLPIGLGIGLGLTLGKPIGLIGAAWLATRAGLAELPAGVSWAQMIGVGCLGGIGFTMSLFIASLAFADTALLTATKLAILLASLSAGGLGVVVLYWVSEHGPVPREGDGSQTQVPDDA